MSFVHLHNHSEFSLLNGAIRVKDLVSRAKEFGMDSIAITDYGNLFGAVEFFLEAKSKDIKPIIGVTVFHPSNDDHTLRQHRRGIDHLFQIVLIIQNEIGYRNLCELVTRSYMEGFYYKPRIDFKMLEQYNEGLIALSGGWGCSINHYLYEGSKDIALDQARKYAAIFKDRFYIELQENGIEGQHDLNLLLIDLAKELSLPVVGTNNCHYLNQEDAEAFETLTCIQTGATLRGAGDHLKFTTDEYYFKSSEEMIENFSYCPEAIENTLKISETINFEFDLKTYHFPKFEPPQGLTLDQFLEKESYEGLEKRWPLIVKNRNLQEDEIETEKKLYQDRIRIELDVIQSMGFSGYFLIVSDFIRHAKKVGIPVGPGRGSAAGSLVSYCTDITDLDPIPYKLLFERFLNPERISMPDVDIDFCMHRREEVLDYVAEKYGNVSQIITFGKMKAKAVIRDVARVMEMDYADADRIAKLIPNALNITLEEALEQEPRLKDLCKNDPQVGRLMDIAKKLEGLNRHASTHAAGVVISDKSLTNFLPLYRGSNEDVVTQFDMKFVEKIGLIKFDFLGLKTLTVIENAVKMVKENHNEEIDILKIPMGDEKVFELLCRGDGGGVFQLESSGMKDLLVRMKPSCFEDMVALVALYRPGPLGSGMVDDFINRKQGKTKISYDLPQLEPIMKDTYGVIVYQEQVMQIAQILGGYSLGEADLLRRAMGKKKKEEMDAQRVRFLEGANKKQIPQDKAEKIFDLMAKFAEYGFNKSHSAAYALVSYQTAFLKAHYTEEYLASIMNCDLHNTDRILYFKLECEAHNIELLPPSVNESDFEFKVIEKNKIRYGLGAVKNVGEGAIEAIIEYRNKIGEFKSFYQFCEELDFRRVNKRVVESLIKCGAFDEIDPNRARLFSSIEKVIDVAVKRQKDKESGQTDLFGMIESAEDGPTGVEIEDTLPWIENQQLSYEKEALGLYMSGHPLNSYASEMRKVVNTFTNNCDHISKDKVIIMAGMLSSLKIILTKKGKQMAFAQLDDLYGQIEVIFFADTFKKYSEFLDQDTPLMIKGNIERGDEGAKLMATEVSLLGDTLNRNIKCVHFKVPVEECSEPRLHDLSLILKTYQGSTPSILHVLENNTETVMELPYKLQIEQRDEIRARVNALFGHQVVDYQVH